MTITLVNPVYKETGRIRRREEHPHGEDSVRYKIKVLRDVGDFVRWEVGGQDCADPYHQPSTLWKTATARASAVSHDEVHML